MTGDERAQAHARQGNGAALNRAFPPDRAADADMDRLIQQLDGLPWPSPANKGTPDARH